MTKKKSPSVLVSSDKVNETQRKSLGLGHFAPREKLPQEAGPVTFRSSQINPFPKFDDVRPGANDHLNIGRVGVFC